VLSFFKSLDDHQYFLVIDLIVVLNRGERLAKGCHWMPLTVCLLKEDYSCCVIGAICFDAEERSSIWGG